MPAVGDHDEQRPAARVAHAARRASSSAGRQQAGGQRGPATGAAARRSRSAPPRRPTTVGGSSSSASCAAERDQADLVAPLVGVGQQRQHGALDRAHPLPRGHRAGGVDDEQHQVALAALADGLAQVAARAAAASVGAAARDLVRRGGAQGRGQVHRRQPARRACGRPVSRPLPPSALRRGGRTTPPRGCDPGHPQPRRAGTSRRPAAAPRRRRVAGRRRPGPASGVSAPARRTVGAVRRSAPPRRRSAASAPRSGPWSSLRQRLVEGVVELLLVESGRVERGAAAAVRQREPGRRADVLGGDLVAAVPGGERHARPAR